MNRRAFLAATAAGLLATCGRRAGRGGPARRVVSLGPNATEILFALGAGHVVVGVSRYDDFPPEVATLPRVGGMLDPSFEAIVALRPDAVVGARGPVNRAVLDRLEAMGVRTLFPSVESVAEIDAAIGLFAALVGASDRAAPLRARITARIEQVRAAVRGRAAPGVLAVFGQRPISVAGPGSFVDELLTLAGGRNVVRSGPRWPTLALEAVLELAPEVVLDLTSMEGHGTLRDAWRGYTAIPAVRDGRVVRLDDPMLMRPGPRVGEALAVYARAIHPGLVVRG
jgi:iron complex transport system substrate-binding protein